MELSQLRYFITVSRLGNMSKAAETLYVSQPNLSTSKSRLEEQLGVDLELEDKIATVGELVDFVESKLD